MDSDETFDGVVDFANRFPVKSRFVPVNLPATRPSFPISIGQGTFKDKEKDGPQGSSSLRGSNVSMDSNSSNDDSLKVSDPNAGKKRASGGTWRKK